MDKVKKEILIDEANKTVLIGISQQIKALSNNKLLICNAILNAKGLVGTFDLSSDCSRLIKENVETDTTTK